MKRTGKQYFTAVTAAACCFLISVLCAGPSYGLAPPDQKQAIPFNRLGAEVDAKYGAMATGPVATAGGYRLAAKMQALEAEVTSGGLTVTSLAKSEGGGSFSIVPFAVNGVKAARGAASLAGATVVLNRGIIAERFTASTDGIRQDFIIAAPVGQNAKPAEIDLALSVTGATVKDRGQGNGSVLLTLAYGRKLVYSRLRAHDAGGHELPARMEVQKKNGAPELHIIVAAQNAPYPVTIDPTITDADWVSMNSSPGVSSGPVYALARDSQGNVYVGGTFTVAGDVAANNIARWNGSSWSALGLGIDNTVYALLIDSSDNVTAGGGFTTAGGITVNSIAKWNGTSWSALGTGMDARVNAIAFDSSTGNLYAGGDFTTAGGVPASYIAQWNGTTWSALGSGMGGSYPFVYALAFDNSTGTLYAGGYFTTAGGVDNTTYIAQWNGTTWSGLGSGMDGTVNCLAIDSSDNLTAGGDFTTAGGVAANYIAKWNGASWSALGSGMSYSVRALAFDSSDNLTAGGIFATAGGSQAYHIAKWNGATWSALGSGMNIGGYVYALAFDPSGAHLYAGGSFTTAGGVPLSYIAQWNGTAWSALGPGMNNTVEALALDSTGNLYVGGEFTGAGNIAANYIAKWDGSSWSALGSGMDNIVKALAIDASGTNLYAGGNFMAAGGNYAAKYIAKWNGTEWSALGGSMNNSVNALAIDSSDNLTAGGGFTTIGGVTMNYIAKWNGTAWSALDNGLNNDVLALAFDSDNLTAGGWFTSTMTASPVTVNRIAKWNGSAWSALGTGIKPGALSNPYVAALAFDSSGNLYAGGKFAIAGDNPANYIAQWDGSAWSALDSGMNGPVRALVCNSDNLTAGGEFTTAGGINANYIAQWNGSAWSALGSGMGGFYSPYVSALAFDTSGTLYVGGWFAKAGDKVSPYIAKCILYVVTTTTTTAPTTTTTQPSTTTTEPITTTTQPTTTTTVPSTTTIGGTTTTTINGATTTTAPVTTTEPVTTTTIAPITTTVQATTTIAGTTTTTINGATTTTAPVTTTTITPITTTVQATTTTAPVTTTLPETTTTIAPITTTVPPTTTIAGTTTTTISDNTTSTTTTPAGCIDKDADGYGDNCTAGPDCDDSDAFYNEVCPACTVTVIPGSLGWLLGEKEKTRRLLVIGNKGTEFAEATPVRWETSEITVLSKRVFFNRFMFMKVSIDGAALAKGDYRALIGTCTGKLTLVK